MLVMQEPVFRRFWYPTLRLSDLESGPKPFTLLGQELVLWLREDGSPAALEDRCPHRRARLSVDSRVVGDTLRCGYHGWRFDGTGTCTLIPQMPEHTPGPKSAVPGFQAKSAYGFAWVCLSEAPLLDIPSLRHADDPGFRQVFEYEQDWAANCFRICENALDLGHVSFVHRVTFGDDEKPVSPKIDLHPFEHGVRLTCLLPVANRAEQQKNLGIPESETVRTVDIRWLLPSTFVLHFTYPNGLIHQIVGFATPIDDGHVRRIQFAYRSDTEADAPGENVAAFDRAVGQEDRRILESCDVDFPLDPGEEAHMTLDRPGILMRRVLSELIEAHRERAAAE